MQFGQNSQSDKKCNIFWAICPKIKYRPVLESHLHSLQVVYWMEGYQSVLKIRVLGWGEGTAL